MDDQWGDRFTPRFFLCFPCCYLHCAVEWPFCHFHPHVHHRPTLYFGCMFYLFLFVSAALTHLSSTVLELAFSHCHFLVSHGFRLVAHLSDHRNHCRSSLYFDCILLIFFMLSLSRWCSEDSVLKVQNEKNPFTNGFPCFHWLFLCLCMLVVFILFIVLLILVMWFVIFVLRFTGILRFPFCCF